MIHKEQPEIISATKSEPSILKPTSWIQNKWESRNSGTKGKTEFYEFGLPNSKWTEEKFFQKVTFVML